MMEFVFIFCLALRIFLAIGCMLFAYLISRIHFASTVTYRLFTIGFFLLTTTYIQSLFFTKKIADFLTGFNQFLVFESQIASCVFVLLMFVGFNRKYFAVKNILPPEEKRDRPDNIPTSI